MANKRVAIMTGGGDCPGLNAVIYGAVRVGVARYGWEVLGVEDATRGLIDLEYRFPHGNQWLSLETVRPIPYSSPLAPVIRAISRFTNAVFRPFRNLVPPIRMGAADVLEMEIEDLQIVSVAKPGADSVELDKAGFYEIRSMTVNAPVAVNPIPRESDLTHGNAEEMTAAWISSQSSVVSQDEQPTSEEQDRRQRIWSLLLITAALFLLTELMLSNFRMTAIRNGRLSDRQSSID